MKKLLFTLALFSLLMTACASALAAPSVDSQLYVSQNLDTSYENALAARQQLTLGSLKLAETSTPLTAQQAKNMLPLWQALANMTRSGNSSPAEVNAILAQIESAFTAEQLTAIREMKLTSADIQAWASANGVALGSGSGGGQGGGSGMSPEARATKQAAEGVSSGAAGGGASSALLNALISYLQALAE